MDNEIKEEHMTEREKQWNEFSDLVAKHLRVYTTPQYGDVGEDEITNYTVETCIEQVRKYCKRYGSQSRDGQQELDFIKMAHYIQCAWEKHNNKINDVVNVNVNVEGELILSYNYRDDQFFKENGYEYVGVTYDSCQREINIWRII
ncbi:MAG: hypothetical protein KQ78_02186 [Candidatus Izimaplasma bacterium HR2]|nr:MAG: hypothetical protein KQ78_02186 [Candidatus Izimaplasma bacterium HR2]